MGRDWPTTQSESDADSEPALAIDKIDGRSSHLIKVQLEVQGKPLVVEVDTGAQLFPSYLKRLMYDTLFSHVLLNQASVGLHTYTGESISIRGEISVNVCYGNQTKQLSLMVVKGKGHNLFGRDWLAHFCLDWKTFGLATLENSSTTLDMLLECHADVC